MYDLMELAVDYISEHPLSSLGESQELSEKVAAAIVSGRAMGMRKEAGIREALLARRPLGDLLLRRGAANTRRTSAALAEKVKRSGGRRIGVAAERSKAVAGAGAGRREVVQVGKLKKPLVYHSPGVRTEGARKTYIGGRTGVNAPSGSTERGLGWALQGKGDISKLRPTVLTPRPPSPTIFRGPLSK